MNAEGNMKKIIRSGMLSIVMLLIFSTSIVHAFNAGAHLYIADRVFKKQIYKIDLFYGSIAPDLSLYVKNTESWPNAFDDTHYDSIDLRDDASGFTQTNFARGWLTHNEQWGADYIAHNATDGYVKNKAETLSSEFFLNEEFAHYAIEVAIDLLLSNNDDDKLGEKLLKTVLFRSWKDRNLLVNVFVFGGNTDWLTLASAEFTFRNLVIRYAMALSLPEQEKLPALALLGVQLAQEFYGMEVTPEEVQGILTAAITLCESDYEQVIRQTVKQIKANIF